ncbi:MAG: TonB-dependent receptor [Bacteroidetes bacterium]|nr:TonB-dependent receptor [Bacteroidota bacterium]
MRLFFFFGLLFLGLHALRGQGSGLQSGFTLTVTEKSFEEILAAFESQTGVVFQYDAQLLPPKRRYTVNYRNIRADQALTEFLQQNGLGYTVRGSSVILSKLALTEAKKQYLLSGSVAVKQSGEYLVNAMVFIVNTGRYFFTSEAGFFSAFLNTDTNVIIVSYPGFELFRDTLIGDRNYVVKYTLDLRTTPLPTAEVKAFKGRELQTVLLGQGDHNILSRQKIRWLPHFLGEPDIIRTMSMMPGVVGGSEGMLGMYVRGGAADQNLVLLDDVPVFNSYHLYGIFSIFNDEVVKSATLMRGSFPARYGGRLSSVISVQSREGNIYRIKGSVNLDILSSRLFLEGPLIKNRTAFTASFRRSYLDFLVQPAARMVLLDDSLKNNVYYFWDANASVTHRFSNRSRLTLSAYTGRDVIGLDEKAHSENAEIRINERRQQLSNWGNTVATLRWQYQPDKRTGILIKAHTTGYNYSFRQNYRFEKTQKNTPGNGINDFTQYRLRNGILDAEVSAGLIHRITNGMAAEFGLSATRHQFIPGNRSLLSRIDSTENEVIFNDPNVLNYEVAGYGEIQGQWGERWFGTAGIRMAVFFIDASKRYYLPEPRLQGKFHLGKNDWVRASATRTRQFFHLLTNLTLGLPSDLWVPSSVNFKPSQCDQISLGHTHEFRYWQLGSEVFYKKLNHLLEYKDNAGYVTSAINWEDAVTQGKGEAWGMELLAEKHRGRLTGWLAYTLMWNQRQFAGLNQGKTFPARYDRRHNLYVAAVYQLAKGIQGSLSWMYNSGFAFTLPVGSYISGTPSDPYREIFIYGDRNIARSRDNHRLDIAVSFVKSKVQYTRTWTVGLFNVYNRLNPFYLTLGYDKQGNRKLFQTSMLPLLPNISFKIAF